MKTTSTLLLTSLLATSFLSAGPLVKAAIIDNNGNPNSSFAKKATKVAIADNVIDPSDTAAQKVVKASIVKGDQRKKRQLTR
jgi:hypothetical protein